MSVAMTPDEANPRAAIAFALSLHDHAAARPFLAAWVARDVSGWPEFEGFAIWCATDGDREVLRRKTEGGA